MAGLRTQRQKRDPLHHAGSLDEPLTDDEGAGTLEDIIEDLEAAQDFQVVEIRPLYAALYAALDSLTEDEQKVIWARYWHSLTLEQAGKALGMTKHTVKATADKALRKLRHPSRGLLRLYR